MGTAVTLTNCWHVLTCNACLCSTQAKEYLRCKSQGCAELSQAQQPVGQLVQNRQEQGSHMDLLQQQLQEFEQVEAEETVTFLTNVQPLLAANMMC